MLPLSSPTLLRSRTQSFPLNTTFLPNPPSSKAGGNNFVILPSLFIGGKGRGWKVKERGLGGEVGYLHLQIPAYRNHTTADG
jgi:hypothetical protein